MITIVKYVMNSHHDLPLDLVRKYEEHHKNRKASYALTFQWTCHDL